LLAAILLLSSQGTTWAQEEAGNPLDRIGPQAVFKPPSRDVEIAVFEKIQACGAASAGATDSKFVSCVVSTLQQAGASPEATAFAARLKGEGYLDTFRKMGRVGLASVAYPIRANDNGEYLLVNGMPQVVHVSDPDALTRSRRPLGDRGRSGRCWADGGYGTPQIMTSPAMSRPSLSAALGPEAGRAE
jgi:hypothetical protein